MSKRIEELEKRKEQIEQQLRDARARETKKQRKIETRCKIILGGLVLKDPDLLEQLEKKASEKDAEYLEKNIHASFRFKPTHGTNHADRYRHSEQLPEL